MKPEVASRSLISATERPRTRTALRTDSAKGPEWSLILETGSRAVFHTILVFSLYLFFSGHNSPGGGFIAGLVAGGALIIRYLATGPRCFDEMRGRPEVVLGSGIVVAAGYGVISALFGRAFGSYLVEVHLPLEVRISFTSSLVFDVGVYLVVVGLVMAVLHSLGKEHQR